MNSTDLRVKRPLEALLWAGVTSVLGHLLSLGRVGRIQASAGRGRSGSGRDHPRGTAGARMRQELGAVRGCSTHLGGEVRQQGNNKAHWVFKESRTWIYQRPLIKYKVKKEYKPAESNNYYTLIRSVDYYTRPTFIN